MSPQVEFLKNLIAMARTGNEQAIKLLRQVIQSATEKAPLHDLLTIGECLYHIGIEATCTQIGRN